MNMNNLIYFLLTLLALAVLPVLVWAIHREHRRRERRCQQCGSKVVKRIPKLYPKEFRDAKSEREHNWQKRLRRSSGIPCRFYMFKECAYCGRFTLERSDDKVFPRFELEWKQKYESGCFKHEPELFRKADIPSPISDPPVSRKSAIFPRHLLSHLPLPRSRG